MTRKHHVLTFFFFPYCTLNRCISMACEVHLGCAPNRDSVEIYLTSSSVGPVSDATGNSSSSNSLFVWIDAPPEDAATADQTIDETNLKATVGDVLPERYAAAIAFLGGPLSGGKQQQPFQCITLQPSSALTTNVEETKTAEDAKSDDGSTDAAAAADEDLIVNNNNLSAQAALLQALQLYSRNLFLPAIQKTQGGDNMPVLENKIRELSVAIGQSQRSAKLPTVVLTVDPSISTAVNAASNNVDPSNVDWTALGLASKLQDDDYLNQIQAGVSNWIGQIRKLTVLTKSTPFPMVIVEATDGTPPDVEEITFWNQLSNGLAEVQAQLQSPPVEITL